MDKEFDLNIVDERITETDFQRSTAVYLSTADVRVQIGAAVSASRIDLTLRNVTGHVKFVGSLEPLERLLRRLRN